MKKFWDLFKTYQEENHHSNLHKVFSKLLPNSSQEEQVAMACVAGLLARVAFVDLKFHSQELLKMESILQEKMGMEQWIAKKMAEVASEEVKRLGILEHHLYAHPLNDLWNEQQKYQILEALFALAASDGTADHLESEEIRQIAGSLRLDHRHYISARATVLESLKVLRKDL